MDNAQQHCDIVIIGGSVSGCACAIAIKQLLPDLSITIIERNAQQQSQQRIGETLPGHVCVPLQQLNLWQAFVSQNYLPAHGTYSAWGNSELHVNEFITSPYGNGWHLDRVHFDQWLRQQALNTGTHLIYQNRVTQSHKTDYGWRLTLPSQTINCRFVIDASGKNASFASKQGANKIVDDKLVGLYRYYRAPAAIKDSNALIESHKDGWWYSALLPDNKWVVALMTDADIAQQNHLHHDEVWQQWLAQSQHTANRLQQAIAIDEPTLVSAPSQCLHQLAGKQWLATGDAAFSFDPLSSLGIFKALRMSIYTGFAIKDYFNNKDPELRKYQQVATAEYQDYQNKKQQYYLEETRFSQQPFWQRRHDALISK